MSYLVLEQCLEQAGASVEPAECHGMLCGIYCMQGAAPLERWSDLALGEDLAPGAPGERARVVMEEALADSAAALDGDGASFAPLLPGDDRALGTRLEAFAAWCSGFLTGLGLGGLGATSPLGDAAREFLADLPALAAVDSRVAGSDEAEGEFVELVEYVRVGVMHVADDLGRGGANRSNDGAE